MATPTTEAMSPMVGDQGPSKQMYQPPKTFEAYMKNKVEKLEAQFEQERTDATSGLFKDLGFFINGYTEPSYQQLKRLIAHHSGRFYHYYDKERVTHVLTSGIPQNKFKFFSQKAELVQPSWLMACIEKSQLLPTDEYKITQTGSKSFVQRFFDSSRLHHLSRWRTELQEYAAQLMQEKQRVTTDFALILHVDVDCFFVSASCAYGNEPGLIDSIPLGVAHAKNGVQRTESTSDIASCNYVARSFGIKNGMSVSQAKNLCPQLQLLSYNFELYNSISRSFYKILSEYATSLEAVSCDEVYLDISGHLAHYPNNEDEVKKCVACIKQRIKEELKINVSIGASYNKLLARLCTRLAKPNGIAIHINPTETEAFLAQFEIRDIPGIGSSICAKLTGNVR